MMGVIFSGKLGKRGGGVEVMGVIFSGKLGKTMREVELLRFRAPRDPCDALLQDWASRDPDATVKDLVSIMQVIQRLDVIKTIEDYSL